MGHIPDNISLVGVADPINPVPAAAACSGQPERCAGQRLLRT
jgi:hypothetical protein